MSTVTRMMAAGITCIALAAGLAAETSTAATPHLERATVVWVYLDRATEPTLVAKSMLSRVHACHDGTCKASMVGYPDWVFVRKQDVR